MTEKRITDAVWGNGNYGIVARWLSMRILNRNIFFFFLFFLLSCLGSKCLYWFYIVGSHFGLSVLLFLSSFERSG